MSKHTPAPWNYRKHINSEYGDVELCSFRIEGPAGSIGSVLQLATVVSDCIEDHEANARLIAAAPDLLEALIDAVCALECCGKDYPAAEKARAAIAKARGDA